jgi:hypothetical protein
VIRPTRFDREKLKFEELEPIMRSTAVSIVGWEFPFLDNQQPTHNDVDWIGQELDWSDHKELWRFYRSGQFIHIAGMVDDWRDESEWRRKDADWQPGQYLGFGLTIYRFTEIFEFAARLATSPAGDDVMHVDIKISGLAGRALSMDVPGRFPLVRDYKATLESFPIAVDVPRTELIARSRELAASHAQDFYMRFGFSASTDIIREIQQRVS